MAGKPRDKGAGGAVTSAQGMHLGLRLGPRRAVQLRALVDRANTTARSVGLPATITPSGLVMMWITERLDAETTTSPELAALVAEQSPEVQALEREVAKRVEQSEARRAVRSSRKRAR